MPMATRSRDSMVPASPPEAWEPLERLARLARRPLERFLRIEAASGILLLAAAAFALAWANSPWSASYRDFWHTPIGVRFGSFVFERTLEWLVNDVLMVIFFFVVGMEIRRELHHGELAERRRAALPAAAALGGMLVPAALYLCIAGSPQTRSGWGVPMATDIAFALGVLALLGTRVPAALRVLLLALAVIDDLGAIIVIALFYSSGLALHGLLVAGAGIAGVLVLQRIGVRAKFAYVAPSIVAWGGIYAAGVHPTIAGVIIGILTPVRAWLGPEGFLTGVQTEMAQLARRQNPTELSHEELALTLRHVEVARREAVSPAESLIEMLHPWVAYFIMPVFALANAGVSVSSERLDAASWSVLSGVALGLLAGKPLGVLLACRVMLSLGLGALPRGIGWRHLPVLGVVAGIGFTMALFVAQLGFTDPALLSAAKLGVLAASAAAGVIGLALGRLTLGTATVAGAARTADEAERSAEA
jgi:Na+:H+ antiporter, NhaA family